MAFSWSKLSVTYSLSDAVAFSNKFADHQTAVPPEIEDQELSELQIQLEKTGFSVRYAMEGGKDLAFHLDRANVTFHGILVLRKAAISVDLLSVAYEFIANRKNSQILIVNSCNSMGDNPAEEVPDFWICLIDGHGIMYQEANEVSELFHRKRSDLL
jgi:hypothetical protein